MTTTPEREALAAEVVRLADDYAMQRQRTNIFDDVTHEIRRDLHEAIDRLAARAPQAAPQPTAQADATYTLDQIASACVYAEVSDGQFESMSIALAGEKR